MSLIQKTQDLIFKQIHGNRLIYNTCWEDPRIDRKLLQFDETSSIVMITSAGCNALDYLLDNPAEIHTVDVNYRQNALLRLKLALLRESDFATTWQMFGQGHHESYEEVYQQIRGSLPDYAQNFWDEKQDYFNPQHKRGSLYYRGASGDAAWFVSRLLERRKDAQQYANQLIEADNLEEQEITYEVMEPQLFSKFNSWMVKQPIFMALLGVPRPQIKLIDQEYPDGVIGYVRDHLRTVVTKVPIHDNYFWRVYLTGVYTQDCCPNYLKEENFETLKERTSRIKDHTCTLTEFLKRRPDTYSHFVLLDHQDWLAWHDYSALAEEWHQIFKNSRPGTKILMRSAGSEDMSFLPDFVRQRVRFCPELTDPLHPTDRVGTYRSLHMAEVL